MLQSSSTGNMPWCYRGVHFCGMVMERPGAPPRRTGWRQGGRAQQSSRQPRSCANAVAGVGANAAVLQASTVLQLSCPA